MNRFGVDISFNGCDGKVVVWYYWYYIDDGFIVFGEVVEIGYYGRDVWENYIE